MSGDTCFSLGLSNEEAESQGYYCNSLLVGQSICVPKFKAKQSLNCDKPYTVRAGDTCYALGKKINLNLVKNQFLTVINLKV